MEFRHSKIQQDLALLGKSFEQLSSYLNEVAKEIASPGVLPYETLVERITSSRKDFEAVRSGVHGLAQEMLVNPLPGIHELGSIASLGQLLRSGAIAEEQKAALEAEQANALFVLSRILSIRHRDHDDFKPLADCLETAQTLHNAIASRKWPARHPQTPEILAEKHPLTALLNLVSKADLLDDDVWIQLEEVVTNAYGRALTVAASRGKLVLAEARKPGATPAEQTLVVEPKAVEAKLPDPTPAVAKGIEPKAAGPAKAAPPAEPVRVVAPEAKPAVPAPAPAAVAMKPEPAFRPPAPPPAHAVVVDAVPAAQVQPPQPAAQIVLKAEAPKEAAPPILAPPPVPAPVAVAPSAPPAVSSPAESPEISALARAVAPPAPPVIEESPAVVALPGPAPVDAKPAPAPVAAPKPPAAETVRPVVAAVPKPTPAPAPAPRPVAVPAPERRESGNPRVAVAEPPAAAPQAPVVADPVRKEPRVAPAPQAVKMEPAEELEHDADSADDSKKVDPSRPQRWGFWRGNR